MSLAAKVSPDARVKPKSQATRHFGRGKSCDRKATLQLSKVTYNSNPRVPQRFGALPNPGSFEVDSSCRVPHAKYSHQLAK